MQIYIYTDRQIDVDVLKQTVKKQFGLDVTADLTTVPLSNSRLLSPDSWPRFTLLGQTLGAAMVAFSAAQDFVPEVCALPISPRGRKAASPP